MKKVKGFTVIFAVVTMVMLILSGCGGTESAQTNPAAVETTGGQTSAQTAAAADDGSKNVAITIAQGAGVTPPAGDEDVVRTGLEKALNITISMQSGTSGDDYNNQLNVQLAGGGAPDIFGVPSRNQLVDLVNKGYLLNLTPYLDKLADYQKLAADSMKKGYIGKEFYSIVSNMNVTPSNTLWIRKDWLDSLGLKAPATLDELLEVAKQFTFNDPDKNGSADTYGYGGYSIVVEGIQGGGFNDIFGAYGVPIPGNTYIQDGAYHNSLKDSATKDALGFIKKMYDAGVLEPAIFSNSYTQAQQLAIQGKIGIVQMNIFEFRKQNFADQIKQVNPKAEWVQLPSPKGPGGAYTTPKDVAGGGSLFAIPATIKNDTVKLERILKLINYISTGDGAKLVQYGEKGRHYNEDASGNITITDLLGKEGGYFFLYQIAGRPEDEYYKTKFPYMSEEMDYSSKAPRITVYNSLISLPSNFNQADASTYINEQLVRFSTGLEPLDNYQKFLDTLDSQFNYKAYTDSSEQQLKEMGYVK